jgi:acyl carrier protein
MEDTDLRANYLPTLLDFFDNLPNLTNGAGSVTPDTQLLADGVLDSLNLFLLISHVEDRLGIAIDPDDVMPENFATLDAVCTLLERSRRDLS